MPPEPTFHLRHQTVVIEEIRHEGGPAPDRPLRRMAALALVSNPYAGSYVPDILAGMSALEPIGEQLATRLVTEAGGPDRVEGYGKGAIVELPSHYAMDDWAHFMVARDLDYMMPIKAPSHAMDVFREELVAVGRERSDIVAVTAAMKYPTGLDAFADEFALTFPLFEHYGVDLWVPGVGGRIDPGRVGIPGGDRHEELNPVRSPNKNGAPYAAG